MEKRPCIKILQNKVFNLIVRDVPSECTALLSIINNGRVTGDITGHFKIQERTEENRKIYSLKPPFSSSCIGKYINGESKKDPYCQHTFNITITNNDGDIIISKELLDFVIIGRSSTNASDAVNIFQISIFDTGISESSASQQKTSTPIPAQGLPVPSLLPAQGLPVSSSLPKGFPGFLSAQGIPTPKLPPPRRVSSPSSLPAQGIPILKLPPTQRVSTPSSLPWSNKFVPLNASLQKHILEQYNIKLRLQPPNNIPKPIEWKNKEVYNKMMSMLVEEENEKEENNKEENEKESEDKENNEEEEELECSNILMELGKK